MKPVNSLVLTITFVALGSVMFPVQIVTSDSGLISYLEGKVYLDEQLAEPSSIPIRIKGNSVVRTEDGRAEISLAGGVSLFLGDDASVKVIDNSPYNNSRFELLNGSVVVMTDELGSLAKCENEVTLSDFGLYRFDRYPTLSDGEKLCGVKVYKGAAAVQLATVIAVMTSGRYMSLNLRCGDHAGVREFNIDKTDSLDDWSRQRVSLNRSH